MLPTSPHPPIIAEGLQIETSLAEDAFMQLLPFQPVQTGPEELIPLLSFYMRAEVALTNSLNQDESYLACTVSAGNMGHRYDWFFQGSIASFHS